MLMSPKLVSAMDQSDVFGDRFQHQCPINSGVSTTCNQHVFSFKLFLVVHKIMEIGGFIFLSTGNCEFTWCKSTIASCNNDSSREVCLLLGRDFKQSLFSLVDVQYFFIETDCRL